MKQVKNKNTAPELFVRKILWELGFRYRVNVKSLPGSPDIANKKFKKVIFINGCFWHGHTNCKKAKLPHTRTEYWKEKIRKNIERDSHNIDELNKLGYDILIIWECEINKKSISFLKEKLIVFINK